MNYYVYITKNERLVYKKISCDNFLNLNDFNSYGHKIILKEYASFKHKKQKIKKINRKNNTICIVKYRKEWWK